MTTSSAFNYRVFFDPATGQINGYEHSNTPSLREGQDYIDFDHAVEHRHLIDKVDLATRTIIEMTDAEKYAAQLPAEHEVMAAIRRELDATLETQFPDYPASDDERAQWLDYRVALRRLSDLKSDPVAMVQRWPVRPDQQDPIAHLRARVK